MDISARHGSARGNTDLLPRFPARHLDTRDDLQFPPHTAARHLDTWSNLDLLPWPGRARHRGTWVHLHAPTCHCAECHLDFRDNFGRQLHLGAARHLNASGASDSLACRGITRGLDTRSDATRLPLNATSQLTLYNTVQRLDTRADATGLLLGAAGWLDA
ncbi:MAG: hypothetical protein JXB05_03875 [Myxococcaceae bacterium]|nr:hypothetical protein [Myxococcaceae bacterium]